MADLRGVFQIQHSRDPFQGWRPNATPETDLSADGTFEATLTIGTSEENVSFGDLTPGEPGRHELCGLGLRRQQHDA
jgi:hypothetical protein